MKYNIEVIHLFHEEESIEQRKEAFNRKLFELLEQENLFNDEECYDRE